MCIYIYRDRGVIYPVPLEGLSWVCDGESNEIRKVENEIAPRSLLSAAEFLSTPCPVLGEP